MQEVHKVWDIWGASADICRVAASGAVNLLMPPLCPVTGEPVPTPGAVSAAGWAQIHFIEEPCCSICGVPFSVDHGADAICPSCIMEPPAFDRARTAIVYRAPGAGLVTKYKFSDRLELRDMLARWMVRAGRDLLQPGAIIVPVPLHWRRLASRRFNQAGLLAAAIGAQTGLQVSQRVLMRNRATPPQREAISSDARKRNVAGAFTIRPSLSPFVRGARFVLVDDVLTTGATLSACARALKRAGADHVDALVLARVVKGGGEAI